MLSRRLTALVVSSVALSLIGCSLITNVDRTKIDDGTGGTAGTAGADAGGTAGADQGGQSTKGGASSKTSTKAAAGADQGGAAGAAASST